MSKITTIVIICIGEDDRINAVNAWLQSTGFGYDFSADSFSDSFRIIHEGEKQARAYQVVGFRLWRRPVDVVDGSEVKVDLA
ncbi:hypothetical protein [Lichenicoccus sp.]|uniref:hypothetical protein n=1 Tax=Lichenicoccus sp. TaxID=2781899 RepID=UPI003D0EDF2F